MKEWWKRSDAEQPKQERPLRPWLQEMVDAFDRRSTQWLLHHQQHLARTAIRTIEDQGPDFMGYAASFRHQDARYQEQARAAGLAIEESTGKIQPPEPAISYPFPRSGDLYCGEPKWEDGYGTPTWWRRVKGAFPSFGASQMAPQFSS